jgi:hypothetical protein
MVERKRVEWTFVVVFEIIEMNRGRVGSLKSQRNFTNPLGFASTISYLFGCKA